MKISEDNRNHVETVPTIFAFQTDEREELKAYLDKENIGSRRFFRPLHKMEAFRDLSEGNYPVSSKVSRNGLLLPSYPSMKNQQVKKVARNVREFFQN